VPCISAAWPKSSLVDELEIEPRGVAKFERRRAGEADDHRFLRAGEVLVEARGDLLDAVALARPFLPRLERNEGRPAVWPCPPKL